MKLINRLKKITSHPLTSDKKLYAIFRYIGFHLHQRITKGTKVYNFIGNTRFHARRGMAGIVANIYTGLYEFEEMSFLLHFLKEDDIFLDVGSNVGAFSILAAGVRKSQTYAIEPIPLTFSQLVDNIELNYLQDKIIPLNIGVGEEEGTLVFSQHKGTMNHVSTNSSNGIKIPVKTIDQIFEETGDIPNLIKIDVEGYEVPVLKGAEKVLSNPSCHAIIIEINGYGNRYGYEDIDIHNILLDNGFYPYSYMPFERKLIKENSFSKINFNTIYLKNEKIVLGKINQTGKIKVFGKML